MTEQTKIEPALTAMEWESVLHPEGMTPGTYFFGNDGIYYIGGSAYRPDPPPHAVAAVNLYGQPFGFTWDDVDAINEVADECLCHISPQTGLRALADRIAALLPPRDEYHEHLDRSDA